MHVVLVVEIGDTTFYNVSCADASYCVVHSLQFKFKTETDLYAIAKAKTVVSSLEVHPVYCPTS